MLVCLNNGVTDCTLLQDNWKNRSIPSGSVFLTALPWNRRDNRNNTFKACTPLPLYFICHSKNCSHPAWPARRVGEAFVMIALCSNEVLLTADASCWWGMILGSKSNPGQFSGGGRGGGEGMGAMSS